MQINGSISFAESDGPTSELPLDPPHPATPISSLSFSHNHVISGNETGVFSVYDIQTGTPVCSYNFHQGPITSISSTLNNIVVTGGLDGRLQVYNFNTNQLNASFNENKNAITNIIFNNTYKIFMSSSLDGTVKVFNIDKTQSISTIRDFSPVTAFNWLNSLCVTGNQNGEISIYDVNTSQSIYKKKIFGTHRPNAISNISSILIDMDSGLIVSSSKTESLLNVIDMRMTQSIINTSFNKGTVNYLGCDSKSGYIVTGGSDNLLKVIDVKKGFKEIASMKTSSKIVCGDMGNKFVCVGCEDGTLMGYELNGMKCNFGYSCDDRGKVRQCKIINHSDMIITGGDEGVVKELQF